MPEQNKYLDYAGLQRYNNKLNAKYGEVQTTTDTTANTVEVPTSAKGLATLKQIGGMSYKCINLWSASKTFGDYYVNGQGYNAPNNDFIGYKIEVTPSTTYTLKTQYGNTLDDSGGYLGFYDSSNNYISGSNSGYGNTTNTFTTPANCAYVEFCCAKTYNYNFMLNLGSTALPYEAYYEGIHDSAVTKVESVGANRANGTITKGVAYASTGGTYSSADNQIMSLVAVEPNTIYSKNNNFWINYYDSNQDFISQGGGATTFTTPSNCYYVGLTSGLNEDIMLNKGSTALPYAPYEKHELPIPSAIRSITGYGWGVNENCYNYIDLSLNEFRQYVGRVDLGSLNWTKLGNYNYIYKTSDLASVIAKPSSNNVVGNILSNTYSAIASSPLNDTTLYCIAVETNGDIFVNTGTNTIPSGYLYYELATPVITDISSLLDEVHIPIEANGTLELVNTYNNAVPVIVSFDNGLVDVVLTNHNHDIEQQKDIDKLKSGKQDKLTAGSGITISGNTISADAVAKYKNILRLVDSSTGNPVFEFAKVGNTALYDEQTFEDLTKVSVLSYLENIGDTYNSCSYIVVGGEERDFVQVDKTGTTDLFEVVYQGLIGVKYDSGSSEITICFLDNNENVVIDTANIGDDNSASYYFVGKSEEL